MVVTLSVTGIPAEVTLKDLTLNLRDVFDSLEVGNFVARDVTKYHLTKWKSIVFDFDNGYDAMMAQEQLDGYNFMLDDGTYRKLRAKIDHNPTTVPAWETIVSKRVSCIDSDLDDYKIEARLNTLNKQLLLVKKERKLLKATKKLRKEYKRIVRDDLDSSSEVDEPKRKRRKLRSKTPAPSDDVEIISSPSPPRPSQLGFKENKSSSPTASTSKALVVYKSPGQGSPCRAAAREAHCEWDMLSPPREMRTPPREMRTPPREMRTPPRRLDTPPRVVCYRNSSERCNNWRPERKSSRERIARRHTPSPPTYKSHHTPHKKSRERKSRKRSPRKRTPPPPIYSRNRSHTRSSRNRSPHERKRSRKRSPRCHRKKTSRCSKRTSEDRSRSPSTSRHKSKTKEIRVVSEKRDQICESIMKMKSSSTKCVNLCVNESDKHTKVAEESSTVSSENEKGDKIWGAVDEILRDEQASRFEDISDERTESSPSPLNLTIFVNTSADNGDTVQDTIIEKASADNDDTVQDMIITNAAAEIQDTIIVNTAADTDKTDVQVEKVYEMPVMETQDEVDGQKLDLGQDELAKAAPIPIPKDVKGPCYKLIIKKLLKQMKQFVPNKLENDLTDKYLTIAIAILKWRLRGLLKNIEDKISHKEIFDLYRETYPSDSEFVQDLLRDLNNNYYGEVVISPHIKKLRRKKKAKKRFGLPIVPCHLPDLIERERQKYERQLASQAVIEVSDSDSCEPDDVILIENQISVIDISDNEDKIDVETPDKMKIKEEAVNQEVIESNEMQHDDNESQNTETCHSSPPNIKVELSMPDLGPLPDVIATATDNTTLIVTAKLERDSETPTLEVITKIKCENDENVEASNVGKNPVQEHENGQKCNEGEEETTQIDGSIAKIEFEEEDDFTINFQQFLDGLVKEENTCGEQDNVSVKTEILEPEEAIETIKSYVKFVTTVNEVTD